MTDARTVLKELKASVLSERQQESPSPGRNEVNGSKWKARTFDEHKISYPRTEQGNPSFKAGKTGWMRTHPHWLPQLIARANKYDAAGGKFLGGHILSHIVNGRIHAEIHPHRSDEGGTRSLRFSYSDPPLQQMPARDKELAPLIRGVFLPEEGQIWAKPDLSQQEFRFLVHYATLHTLPGAMQAAELYRTDDADFHAIVAEMTGIERDAAKNANFAKIYGAGVKKFAEMVGKPLSAAQAIYVKYDQRLPFVARLSAICEREAKRRGYTVLYDGARRHWNYFEAPGVYVKGAGPCPLEEARRRKNDAEHPWHGKWLRQHNVHTAMNALIQGSAARHTKLWMRACWREGIVPLLQMHDALDCSVTTREQGELVARLGCEVISLAVPMRVDLKFGESWGDAEHAWDDLGKAAPGAEEVEPVVPPPRATEKPAEAFSEEGSHLDTPEFSRAASISPEITAEMVATASINGASKSAMPTVPPPPPPEDPPPDDPPPRGNGGAGNGDGHAHWEDKGNDANWDSMAKAARGYTSGNQKAGGTFETAHVYPDPGGKPHSRTLVFRLPDGDKRCAQQFYVNGQWLDEKPAGWVPLPFNLPAVIKTDRRVPIWLCEGESDAIAVGKLGFVTTTNSEGAGHFTADHAKWLTGKQTVYVVEDNDDAGRPHASKVAELSHGVGVRDVRIISFRELDSLPPWPNGRKRRMSRIGSSSGTQKKSYSNGLKQHPHGGHQKFHGSMWPAGIMSQCPSRNGQSRTRSRCDSARFTAAKEAAGKAPSWSICAPPLQSVGLGSTALWITARPGTWKPKTKTRSYIAGSPPSPPTMMSPLVKSPRGDFARCRLPARIQCSPPPRVMAA